MVMRCLDELVRQAAEMYKTGEISLTTISKKVGISAGTLRKWLLRDYMTLEEFAEIRSKINSAPSKQQKRDYFNERWQEIADTFETTDLSLSQIAEKFGTSTACIKKGLVRSGRYELEKLNKLIRDRGAVARKKNNPQWWERKGVISRGGKYKGVAAPEWMTKKYQCGVTQQHTCVVCEHLGLTEIPKGFVVHHVNGKPDDNRFENLVLMTKGEHMALHRTYLKGVTTTKAFAISKESTLKWVEARRQGADKSTLYDIVCSGQECPAASNVAGTE